MRSPSPATAWSAFARTAVFTAAAILSGYLALAVAIDPYDSGRSRLFSVGAVRPQGPRTALAVRGRDPAFSGAILGNSHIQLVEPARLAAATGIPFVQLSVPATGPGEQLLILDWFLRHHPTPAALVMAADDFWCTDDPALPPGKPFPFWLLERDPVTYALGLLRFNVAQEVVGRIGWLLRRARPVAPADGWWNYEPDYLKLGFAGGARPAPGAGAATPDTPEPHRAGPFPAAVRLAATLARVPAETPVVMVFPPIHASALPRPGTRRAAAEQACKAAIAAALASHPRSAVLDERRDTPESHDDALFFDLSHYRLPVARPLADAIAAAVNRLRARPAIPG
ncbi:hypothetical protein FV226_21875 [Methylobacterium sp. WL12]|uniref:hypothetical protein n=1 Tax=Methylobacterium sp. WL12 TaxID=2603890 RepID=UPI0011C7556B|nr:hypothetical protein [Methylobacterium sp. WL12]TXM67480.1 hypothetical protein FV226_21875 [Methylobacterium sp. WL12]